MKYILLLAFLIAFSAGPSWADCTSPAAPAGRMDYFGAPDHTFKFCNGTSWVEMSGGSGVLSEQFESSQISLPTSFPSVITAAHGLAGKPKTVQLFFINITAEHGYSPGDEIVCNNLSGARNCTLAFTSTNVNAVVEEYKFKNANGTNGVELTPVRWRAVFRAWR